MVIRPSHRLPSPPLSARHHLRDLHPDPRDHPRESYRRRSRSPSPRRNKDRELYPTQYLDERAELTRAVYPPRYPEARGERSERPERVELERGSYPPRSRIERIEHPDRIERRERHDRMERAGRGQRAELDGHDRPAERTERYGREERALDTRRAFRERPIDFPVFNDMSNIDSNKMRVDGPDVEHGFQRPISSGIPSVPAVDTQRQRKRPPVPSQLLAKALNPSDPMKSGRLSPLPQLHKNHHYLWHLGLGLWLLM